MLLPLLTWVVLGVQEKPDLLKFKNGTEIKCKITKLDAKGITYQPIGQGAASVTQDYKQIAEIVFWDTPEESRRADREFAAGRHDKAAELYETALGLIEKGKVRALHKPYGLYGLARARAAAKTYDQALSAYSRLRRECLDSPFKREAFLEALDCARKKNDPSEIRQIISEMKSAGESVLALEAEVQQARMFHESGKVEEARAIYEKLAQQSESAIADRARLGVLRCLSRLAKLDELEQKARQILAQKSFDPALAAAAHSATAFVLYRRNAAEKKMAGLREALREALWAISFGPPPKDQVVDDYVQAVDVAARSYRILAEAGKPEVVEEYRRRASQYFTELARTYKETPWGKTAEEELRTLSGNEPKSPQ